MEIEQRLPFDFVPVYTESVHVPTVADEHLQLAVYQFPGLHTEKGMRSSYRVMRGLIPFPS